MEASEDMALAPPPAMANDILLDFVCAMDFVSFLTGGSLSCMDDGADDRLDDALFESEDMILGKTSFVLVLVLVLLLVLILVLATFVPIM